MRAIFRPSTLLGDVRIPGLDEDEATMAVAAARMLLRHRNIPADSVKRLECASLTATGWQSHVQIALGLEAAAVTDVGDGKVAEGSLRITSNAVRLGSSRFGSTESVAVAEFQGEAKDLDATDKATRRVDEARAAKISGWDTRAPAAVPMGAYVPKPTWEQTRSARYRLIAGYCSHCRRGHHPRLDPCPTCGRTTEPRELTKGGQLYSYTIIAAGGGPTEFDPFQDTDGPYGVAIVDFGDAIRVAGLLTETDLESLAIGQRMEPVFRRIYAQEGEWRYGTKFRSARAA